MSKLLKCVECGKNVSSSSRFCPHCKARDFKVMRCAYCKQSIVQGYDGINLILNVPLHEHCYKKVDTLRRSELAQPLIFNQKCKVCKTKDQQTIDPNNFRSAAVGNRLRVTCGSMQCSSCGELGSISPSVEFVMCENCRDFIGKGKGVTYTTSGSPTLSIPYHKTCFNIQITSHQLNEQSTLAQSAYIVSNLKKFYLQGLTKEESLKNIQDAISVCLQVRAEFDLPLIKELCGASSELLG
jgi:hypothetical protein